MLTKQDIEVLIEALGAWENKDATGAIMSSLIGSLVAKNDDQRAEFAAREEAEDKKREAAKKMRKERSIVLQSKLIAMRDSQTAEAFCNETH